MWSWYDAQAEDVLGPSANFRIGAINNYSDRPACRRLTCLDRAESAPEGDAVKRDADEDVDVSLTHLVRVLHTINDDGFLSEGAKVFAVEHVSEGAVEGEVARLGSGAV